MSSEVFQSESFASRVLAAHIRKGRVSHTYLLSGPAQAKKEETALAFAAALNCTAARIFEACTCVSCHKVQSAQHPDVFVIGDDPKARAIKIEEIRQVLSRAALKPYEGRTKVFIFKDADRLTQDASNAFLKTLEEPPEHTVFMLLTEQKSALLDTIVSRAFEIRMMAASSEPLPGLTLEEESQLRSDGWETFFEENTSGSRVDLGLFFDRLLVFFQTQLRKSPNLNPAMLEAMDDLLECKDAAEANTNQKLVLSRLCMQLKKKVPVNAL